MLILLFERYEKFLQSYDALGKNLTRASAHVETMMQVAL
jgi:hypothetical protein